MALTGSNINQPNSPQVEETVKSDGATSVFSEEVIQLLEERLVVNFHRRKIGEVVVRKEVELCIVEVPVRRERLIVEQVNPKYEQLAVVDLGSMYTAEINPSNGQAPQATQVGFASAKLAIEFLESLVNQPSLVQPQIELILTDERLRSAYQKWLEQHTS